jgi:hypothetical protein|tara:strand:- start:4435 stop:4728 length:294 start_codon:yes stop_codon:yes gene_type:complete
MTRKKTPRLAVGDRVIEAPKTNLDHCVQKDHPQYKMISNIIHHRRIGTVSEMVVKKDSRGHSINYAMIAWDEQPTPRLHHVMRLNKLEDDAAKKDAT